MEFPAAFFCGVGWRNARILVARASRKEAKKCGGEQRQIELADVPAPKAGQAVDLLALDQALTELAVVDSRANELVKLR